MHAFDVLGDPVRRRLLELLTEPDAGAPTAGALTAVVTAEFQISQPAVSRHLKVLRDNGFADVTVDGNRRLYRFVPESLNEIDGWLDRYRRFWGQRLDALDTEIARGHRDRVRTEEKT